MDEDKSKAPEEVKEAPEADKPAEAPKAVVSTVEKNYRKPLFMVLAAVILLAGGAFAYMQLNKKDSKDTQNNTSTQETTEEVIAGTSKNIVYIVTDDEQNTSQLLYKKIGDAEGTVAKEFGPKNFVSNLNVSGSKVVAQVSTEKNEQIWFSADDGQSYEMIAETEARASESDLGTQITSTQIASDGESVIYATVKYVNGEDPTYSVKKVVLATKASEDLFTPDAPLVLKGYSVTDGKVHYIKAQCWNCDGGYKNAVYSYNLTDKTEKSWSNTNDLLENFFVNNDQTKAVVITGEQHPEGPGLAAPYGIFELDLSTHNVTTVLASSDKNVAGGYSTDNTLVYSTGGTLFTAGSEQPTFETSSTIRNILFVGKDEVITTTGDYPALKTVRLVKASGEVTTLLESSTNSVVVTYQR